MQEMIARMQAEMAKQGNTAAANGVEARPPTANGSKVLPHGTAHQV